MSFCKMTIKKTDQMYFNDLKASIKTLYPGISSKDINTTSRYTFYYYVHYYPTDIYKALEDACCTFNIEKQYLFNIQLNLDEDTLPVAENVQFDEYKKKFNKNVMDLWNMSSTTDDDIVKTKNAGTGVGGRSGSTRHGYVYSYSKEHSPPIMTTDVLERNKILHIDESKCFWCKVNPKECNDHAHPCCSTKLSQYSYTNALNIVPSCSNCNNRKGGLSLKDWIGSLQWDDDEKEIYNDWLDINKYRLLLNDKMTAYVDQQLTIINEIHKCLEFCAKNEKNIYDYILVKTSFV